MLQFRTTACQNNEVMSQATLIAMFEEGTRTREFLSSLNANAWRVLSFNSFNQEVCLEVASSNGTRVLAISIPNLRGL